MEVTIPSSRGFPCSSQLHSQLSSQSCTDWWHSTFLPSASLLGRAKHAGSYFVNCVAKTFPEQGRCPHRKVKEKKKVLPLEKELDLASWRGGKMFQPPSLQRWFCSLEYEFQEGAPLFAPFLSTDISAGFSCPLSSKQEVPPCSQVHHKMLVVPEAPPQWSWQSGTIPLYLSISLTLCSISVSAEIGSFYLSSLACGSYFPPHTVSAAIYDLFFGAVLFNAAKWLG